MNTPVWFAAGSAALLAILGGMMFTHVRRLWRRTREHPEELGDDWDPFA